MIRLQFIKRVLVWCLFFLFLGVADGRHIHALTANNEYLLAAPKPTWPPEGKKVILPVTRDTWISSAGGERTGSNGRAKRLKLKGQLEYVLLDIDPSALKGKIVTGALCTFTLTPREKFR